MERNIAPYTWGACPAFRPSRLTNKPGERPGLESMWLFLSNCP